MDFINSHKLAFGLVLLSSLTALGCSKKDRSEDGVILRIASSAKIKGLDPAQANDLYASREVGKVYETLLEYHYLKRPYTLIPSLAAEMPSVSKDGRVFTFKIRPGVLFQDDPCFEATQGKGRELVAEDFVYSWKRLADPKVESTGFWILDDKVVGLNEWREAKRSGKADYETPVEGLKALDRYTLQLTLKSRSWQILYNLAMPFAAVVPREAVEKYGPDFMNKAVGTGPFRLQEFNPSSKLTWVKNPTYRQVLYPSEGEEGDAAAGLLGDAGKALPLVDKIVVEIIQESQPLWLNFLAGRLDLSGIPKDNFNTAIQGSELAPELKQKGIQLYKITNLDVTHTSFNMTDKLVGKNKLLRQAISLATDMDEYIKLFYNGRAVRAHGPIPPGLSGYNPNFKNPYARHDVEKAKELLAKAGFPGGKGLPKLTYLTLSDSTSRQSTEFFQKQLDLIGVKLEVQNFSWPEFNAKIKNKQGQIYSFAWGADYPDGENFLQLFICRNVSPGSNDSNYCNPSFDELYYESLKLPDSPERTKLYEQMTEILAEDAPWIFGAHRITYGLSHPWVRNYKPHEFDGMVHKYLRVEKGSAK
jgi:ABC-type transport system substrate-binding protein